MAWEASVVARETEIKATEKALMRLGMWSSGAGPGSGVGVEARDVELGCRARARGWGGGASPLARG